MPKFDLETVERWEHKVSYYDVEADTLQQAFDEIASGNVAYDEHEVIEDPANEVVRLWSARRDEIELDVPDELGADLENVTSGKRLVDAATKALAYICNVNTAEPQEIIDLLREALGVTEEYKVDELAAPLLKPVKVVAFVQGGVVQGARSDGPVDFSVCDFDDLEETHENPDLAEGYVAYQALPIAAY